ncbi:MAG: drug/metabolite transporter (DMT)-like permease [Gammaproteobacteria bacterium]|jgi:drug/metabolite transporter (DMT)-like permease
MIVALSVLWGGSFFFNGVSVTALPTLTIVLLRVSLACVALWAFVIITGRKIPRGTDVWLAFLAMGLMNNVIPFFLIVWGQTHIASSLASILNATTPLFGVIVAGMLLSDERMTAMKLSGVVIGFMGVIVMVGPAALSGLGADLWAQMAVLCASISYAFASVYGRLARIRHVDPILIATGQLTASSIFLAPLVLYIDKPFTLPFPGIEICLAIFALAVFSTAIAYVLFFRILASAGATNVMLVAFLIPVTSILLGYFVLGESLEIIHLLGMALIGFGLTAVDGRIWKKGL